MPELHQTPAAKTFGATSTTDEVLEGVSLSGKRVLVTGVSAGLGVETARALAAHGAEVVGAARDLNKAKAATARRPRRRRERRQASSSLSSIWPRSPACAPAPTRCSPTAGRSTSSSPTPASWPDAVRQDRRRVRDPVRHQPSRPFRAGQPHRLADEAGIAAGQPVLRRPSLLRRRSRRSEFRAHAL